MLMHIVNLKLGVSFDVRKVPADSKQDMNELLNKAQKLINEQK